MASPPSAQGPNFQNTKLVAPIVGNPNLREDLALIEKSGNIPTTTQAIAQGISDGVDNFYKIRGNQQAIEESQSRIDARAVNTDLQRKALEAQSAVQEEQIEATEAALAKKTFDAKEGLRQAELSKEFHQAISSENPQERAEAFLNPKFTTLNQTKQVREAARRFGKDYPQYQGVIEQNYFEPIKFGQAQKQEKAFLNDFNKVRDSYESTGLTRLASFKEFQDAELKNRGGTKVLVLPDGRTIEDIITDPKALNKIHGLHAQTQRKIQEGVAIGGSFAKKREAEQKAKTQEVEQRNQALEGRRKRLEQIASKSSATPEARAAAQAELDAGRSSAPVQNAPVAAQTNTISAVERRVAVALNANVKDSDIIKSLKRDFQLSHLEAVAILKKSKQIR